MNIQGWFSLGLTGLNSLQSNGLSRVFFNTTGQRHQFFSTQPFLLSSSPIHTWLLEKPQFWLYRPLLVLSLLFNMHQGLSLLFFQGASIFQFQGCSHRPQWFWSPQIKSLTVSMVSLSICHEVMGLDATILVLATKLTENCFLVVFFFKQLETKYFKFKITICRRLYFFNNQS